MPTSSCRRCRRMDAGRCCARPRRTSRPARRWSARRRGWKPDTLLRLSEVIAEEVGPAHPVVALSGPSFAAEVAHELPTVVVVASSDRARGRDRADGIPRPVLPAVRQRRCDRRRDWRRAQERHRDRRRRRRRPGARPQRARGADHARAGGSDAARLRGRRAPRNAGRIERPGRSRADVHRRA